MGVGFIFSHIADKVFHQCFNILLVFLFPSLLSDSMGSQKKYTVTIKKMNELPVFEQM